MVVRSPLLILITFCVVHSPALGHLSLVKRHEFYKTALKPLNLTIVKARNTPSRDADIIVALRQKCADALESQRCCPGLCFFTYSGGNSQSATCCDWLYHPLVDQTNPNFPILGCCRDDMADKECPDDKLSTAPVAPWPLGITDLIELNNQCPRNGNGASGR